MKLTPLIIYAGRFQPFHKNHYAVYKFLVKKYGIKNVYICTSDKTIPNRSPFNCKEKKKIITTLFTDIPADHIVQTRIPYLPKELINKLGKTPEEVFIIDEIGQKDGNRLSSGKYFIPVNSIPNYKSLLSDIKTNKMIETDKYPNAELSADKHSYYEIIPLIKFKNGNHLLSGTYIRELIATEFQYTSSKPNSEQIKLFKSIYPKYNKSIYDLLVSKFKTANEQTKLNLTLSELSQYSFNNLSNIVKTIDRIKKINEISTQSNISADDGPATWYKNVDVYSKAVTKLATKYGWNIISYIIHQDKYKPMADLDSSAEVLTVTDFPTGPVKKIDKQTAGTKNASETSGKKAINKWLEKINKAVITIGYKFIKDRMYKDIISHAVQNKKITDDPEKFD